MNGHERYQRLAAIAIDFQLSVSEASELANHLATCQACRRAAGALREDASALRTRRRVSAPEQVRATVLAATDPAQPYGAALGWPESATRSSTCELTRSSTICTRPPLGVNLMALVSRFQTTCCKRLPSP